MFLIFLPKKTFIQPLVKPLKILIDFQGRCDLTMRKISEGHKYWIQYEGVPRGRWILPTFGMRRLTKNYI